MVTTFIPPDVRREAGGENPAERFERIQGRFARQARIATLSTSVSGTFLVHRVGV